MLAPSWHILIYLIFFFMPLNILEVFLQKKKKKVEEVNPLKREIPGHETQTNEKE